ncbi:MAG: carboxypeptidase-like regulatory domain-containing protein [Flavobacteriales bacterium]|nr:carboxypeptidase-like regulatory domain-containing protein [Flavobacteriales bacterium]MBK8530633.1 carboxypeptidase-like regulatory domain-containing protein [Flavobacteriales bacterium]MBP8876901.1 carboxypeptidase-like regulatory domain-containing protein [Flavobacteriales bacterium]
MYRQILRICLFLLPQCADAQWAIHGRVVDEATKEPLAFVHVLAADAREGATSDIDGRFHVQVPEVMTHIRFSYVGYAPQEMVVSGPGSYVITMRRTAVELVSVEVFPTENPAHRIIDRARANRKVNDGMRERSYRYTSYSKTIFTAEVDSTLRTDSAKFAALSEDGKETLDFLDKQYLFLMESVTKKSFIPPAAEKEEVLAMRVSGLKDPSLLALAAQTKTFSVYDQQIGLSQKLYLGPLASGSTNKYLFLLEDTLYQGQDSVFVISYRPRSRTNFNGLTGLLYINTNGYAVQNVTAEAAEKDEGLSIRFQQLHEKVQGKAWFPTQLNAFIYLDNVSIGIGKPYGVARTYLKEIEIDVPIERGEVRGPEVVMDQMSTRRTEEFWNALRVDPLDEKSLRTYHVIDSLGAEVNLDAKLKWFSALTTGKFPLGPVDVLLDKLLRYNGYEGLRLGMGLATNDKVTRYASLGGYFGYGFKDEDWKYGGFLTVEPWYGRDIALKLFHEVDVVESGGVQFDGPKRLITTESARLLYLNRMVQNERTGVQLAFRVNSALKLWLGVERELRVDLLGYDYVEQPVDGVTLRSNTFRTGGITLGARFAFRERLARLPDRELALGTKWPVLSVNAFHAFKGFLEGELAIWRLNASLDKVFHLRLVGDLSLRLMGGIADPSAAYTYLYNLRGTNGNAGHSGRAPVLLAADNTFQTMVANEFLADRYVAFHMKHSFGTLLVKGKHFKPRPGVVYNAAIGSLSAPEHHLGLDFKAMGAPFLEGGLVVDAVFAGLGVGVYLRHGPQAYDRDADNFVFKLTSSFVF